MTKIKTGDGGGTGWGDRGPEEPGTRVSIGGVLIVFILVCAAAFASGRS